VIRTVIAVAVASALTGLAGCRSAPAPVEPLVCPPPPPPVVCPEPQPVAPVASPVVAECPPVPACPPPKPEVSKVPDIKIAEAKEVDGRVLLGEAEYARVMPGNQILEARIDSGATTTSLHAVDIRVFERDGKPWVRFKADNGAVLELPRVRHVRIKGEGTSFEERQVVMIEVQIGSLRQKIEASLTDRDNYNYPLLIGRNFLRDHTLIDVSRKYIQGGKNSLKKPK
jgi:hypothetical protein